MQHAIIYQIRLQVAGQLGQSAFDVVEIGGIPHAIVDQKPASILAIPLDPAHIYDLEEDERHDRMTAAYGRTVDLAEAREFPATP